MRRAQIQPRLSTELRDFSMFQAQNRCLQSKMWTRAKFPPARSVLIGHCTYGLMSEHSVGARRNTTFFIDPHQGEHRRTVPGKDPLIKVQSLICTDEDEDLGDWGSSWGSFSSSSSSFSSVSPCNLLSAIANPTLPRAGANPNMCPAAARPSQDPGGRASTRQEFYPFFLPFTSVLKGQNGSKPSCGPRDDWNGGFLLSWLQSHKLKLIHRLFALSIQKYSIKPSGTS